MSEKVVIKKDTLKVKIKKSIPGWILVSPQVLGILCFTIYPIVSSFIYSFYKMDLIQPSVWIGLENYISAFKVEARNIAFVKSIQNTLIYLVWSIVVGMPLCYVLALLLNKKLKGINAFRIIFYLPCIIPSVISGFIWKNVFNAEYGYFNRLLEMVGLPRYPFLSEASTSMPTYLLLTLWGLGSTMVMWLACLKSIPMSLYEAADIDGATTIIKFSKITLPLSTPYIMYMLIVSIIGAMQNFGPYVMLNGTAGINNSLLFYTMNIYFQAFNNFNIGYASALSWMLFAIIAVLSLISFKTSKWVTYIEG